MLGVLAGGTTRRLCTVSVSAWAVIFGLLSIWNVTDTLEASQMIVVSLNILFALPPTDSVSTRAVSLLNRSRVLPGTQFMLVAADTKPATDQSSVSEARPRRQ